MNLFIEWCFLRDHSAKFFEKLTFLPHFRFFKGYLPQILLGLLLNTLSHFLRKCAYLGVRNVSFSENSAYVLNEWLIIRASAVKECNFLIFFFFFESLIFAKAENLVFKSKCPWPLKLLRLTHFSPMFPPSENTKKRNTFLLFSASMKWEHRKWLSKVFWSDGLLLKCLLMVVSLCSY